jgi:hypothetical protein
MMTLLLDLRTLLEVRRGSVASLGRAALGDQWRSVLYSPTGRPLSSDPLFLNLAESELGFGS